MEPFYRDQRTDNVGGCTDCGIFTATTGTAPNRIFTIEYRTQYFGETTTTHTLDYEVNLHESGAVAFDYTYGLINATTQTGRITSVGVQQNATTFTQYACDPTGIAPPVSTGQRLNWSLTACGTATSTPPPVTPTRTATAGTGGTATATATGCPSSFTQSSSLTPVALNSIACGGGGTTTENRYYRAFPMSDYIP